MQSAPKICVFARSASWKSTVQRIFDGGVPVEQDLPGNRRPNVNLVGAILPKIVWALDSEDCLLEVAGLPGAVAIIELASETAIRDCERVRLSIHSDSTGPVFAVGNESIAWALPLIRVSGFADCAFSTMQAAKIAKRIRRYLTQRPAQHVSIEQWVKENLPY